MKLKGFFNKLGHFSMHMFWGAFAAGWNGAMTAVHGYIAISVGSSLDPENISPPSLHTLGFFFAVRFVIDAVGYFKALVHRDPVRWSESQLLGVLDLPRKP